MIDVFELRHRPTFAAIVNVRVMPLLLAAFTFVLAGASGVALVTQDLDADRRFSAWFLFIGGLAGGGFLVRRAWRIWPAASADHVVMRLDAQGAHLRKGRFREPTWHLVPWSVIEAVTFTVIPFTSVTGPRLARVLRFVPRVDADLPPAPVGHYNRYLGLPPREAALAFIAVSTWDDDLRELLAWVRTHRPGLRVEDRVADPS